MSVKMTCLILQLVLVKTNLFKSLFNRTQTIKKISTIMSQKDDNLRQKYQACMVLHALGDAMGYRNNLWESNQSTEAIHQEMKDLGDVESIECDPINWSVSDDTMLHLANAEWLIDEAKDHKPTKASLLSLIKRYKHVISTEDLKKRQFGKTTVESIKNLLNENDANGYRIPFNIKGYGCGASMRSPCIGLMYPNESELQSLIEISVESSRMTHHHPIGYLGGFVAALFTSYAIQNKPIISWGASMLSDLPLVKQYIENDMYFVNENLENWSKFEDTWRNYLQLRKIEDGKSEPVFPKPYDVPARDEFYKLYALSKRSGSSGHDSVIIAYDALLGCNNDWKDLCYKAILHGGDNDSTGCIAASWFGALNGFKTVPERNYKSLEFKEKLIYCADKLYEAAWK